MAHCGPLAAEICWVPAGRFLLIAAVRSFPENPKSTSTRRAAFTSKETKFGVIQALLNVRFGAIGGH